MRIVHVQTGRPYDIFIERGIIESAGEQICMLTKAQRVMVITDTNVAPLYQWKVINSLTRSGLEVKSFIFNAGEQSKTLDTISKMYDAMAQFRMSRKDIVVALGGGVCGDMAGFAAATYMRGIDFVQIPTSLLAQVDSSVGGKTGVDLSYGKNLVGAFHQPVAVYIDPDTLNTLPDAFIRDGMAEVIKYGCIKDAQLFEDLENRDAMDHIEEIIETCVSIKRDVVNRDEREAGERMLLNFGHTLGHAIEKIYNYTGITHGMAVAVGMSIISRASESAGITEKGTAERICSLCQKYGLPISDKAGFDEIAQEAQSDKKASGDSVNLVLLKKIGDSFTMPMPLAELESFITPKEVDTE